MIHSQLFQVTDNISRWSIHRKETFRKVIKYFSFPSRPMNSLPIEKLKWVFRQKSSSNLARQKTREQAVAWKILEEKIIPYQGGKTHKLKHPNTWHSKIKWRLEYHTVIFRLSKLGRFSYLIKVQNLYKAFCNAFVM